jgi:hypothetical protein
MVSYNGLVNLFGTTGSAGTSEVEIGLMSVSNANNWLARISDSPFSTSGPTGAWATEWFSVWNYLQYGGSCVIGATGSTGAYYNSNGVLNTTNTILHNKNLVPLDLVFEGGNTFSSGAAASVATTRQDCLAVIGNYKDIASLNMSSAYSAFATDYGITSGSKYQVFVAGRKKFTYVNGGIASVYEINLGPDVAGCFARTAQTENIWITPAGMTRGRILNVLYLTQKFSDTDINYFSAGGVNAINSIPGEGTFLLSNITSYPYTAATSASSKINTMMTTQYIKKQMINLLKGFLYQPNNASLRQQVINSTTPIMNTLKASNGVTDYRIVCDETNNTDVIVNSGKLVLDVYCTFVYPAVSITLRILASDTGEVVDTQTV